jgi:hypothetical protein
VRPLPAPPARVAVAPPPASGGGLFDNFLGLFGR